MKENIAISSRPKEQKREVPAGATIISKKKNIDVEEIENGYLIITSWDISYEIDGMKDWAYQCKKRYSKTNPVKVDAKTLAEKF